MSYEKVKTISIKGEEIEITSASNNCRPLYYSKWKFAPYYNINANLREKLFALFKDVLDGNLHLESSVSIRIKNAMMASDYYKQPRNVRYSCYDKASELLQEKYNKVAKLNRAEFDSDRRFNCAVYDKVREMLTDKQRNDLYAEAQHEAYDEVINPMIEAYINNNVDRNKYVVKFGNCYLTKMNYQTYKYTWNKENARKYDLFDAYHNACYVDNAIVERA